jgi:hypothetical protein
MEYPAPLRSYMPRSPEGSDDPRRVSSSGEVNVGETERSISLALGGFALGSGLCRGSLGGLLTALIGVGLLYRGLTGHCQLYQTLEMSTARRERELRSVSAPVGLQPSQGFSTHSPGTSASTGLA